MKHKVVRLVIVGVMAIIAGGAPALSASAVAIQFDLNGVAPVVHTAEGSSSVKVPTIELDFNNMSFKGWNTSPTGNGKSYDAGDTISSDTTLYAQWADGTTGGGEEPDPVVKSQTLNPNLNQSPNRNRVAMKMTMLS